MVLKNETAFVFCCKTVQNSFPKNYIKTISKNLKLGNFRTLLETSELLVPADLPGDEQRTLGVREARGFLGGGVGAGGAGGAGGGA